MTTATTTGTVPDYGAIKTKQQSTWSSGDYAVIGTTLQIVGETLAETIDIVPGERVLDVAAGNGNASLAAARRGAAVTASDYVPTLLEGTMGRARAEGLDIGIETADAENMPFADGAYDVVLSTFGVMFTPNQAQAAFELMRVTRPGGRIGLTNWTPDGFVGEMFKVMGRYVTPPVGVRSPLEWGVESRVAELFGAGVQSISIQPREFVFRYQSPAQWVDVFRTFYGPTHKAFAALDAPAGRALTRDLLELAESQNTSKVGAMRVPSEYLEIVAVTAT